jgi:hypothetical protein
MNTELDFLFFFTSAICTKKLLHIKLVLLAILALKWLFSWAKLGEIVQLSSEVKLSS